MLPDAKTGRIQNQYMLPYLRQNKWDEGIKNGFNEFVSIISKNYDVEIEQEKAEKVEKSPISDPLLVFSFSVLAGYIMVIIPFSYEYYKPRKLLIILKETILAIIYAIALSVIIYFETKNTSVIINDVIWGIIGYIIGGCAQGISYIFKKRRGGVAAFTEDPMEISEEVLLEEAGSSGGGRKLWKFLKNIKTVKN